MEAIKRDIWSVFIVRRRVDRDLRPVFGIENYWKLELSFFQGDWSNADLTDWRFCEVKDKRQQLEYVGMCESPVFPITYPLELLNGKVIDSDYDVNEK